jgi:hypothetical protein
MLRRAPPQPFQDVFQVDANPELVPILHRGGPPESLREALVPGEGIHGAQVQGGLG